MITNARSELFKKVISNRQCDMTIILENIHDPHNIGAILRTCDSVGVGEIFVINTDERIPQERYIGVASSSGSLKWVNIHFFDDIHKCFNQVRKKYFRILATHLSDSSIPIYDMDLTDPIAVVFGNEKEGLSEEILRCVDGSVIIPQMGFVQSLNVSVACAITLYEAFRQRFVKGNYNHTFEPSNPMHSTLYTSFIQKHRKLPG